MGTDLIIFLTKIKQFETGPQNFTNNNNIDVEISIVKKVACKMLQFDVY